RQDVLDDDVGDATADREHQEQSDPVPPTPLLAPTLPLGPPRTPRRHGSGFSARAVRTHDLVEEQVVHRPASPGAPGLCSCIRSVPPSTPTSVIPETRDRREASRRYRNPPQVPRSVPPSYAPHRSRTAGSPRQPPGRRPPGDD